MPKVSRRIEIDQNNKLVIREDISERLRSGAPAGSTKNTDKVSICDISRTVGKPGFDKIAFEGAWDNDGNNALKFRLSGKNTYNGAKEIVFTGDIIGSTPAGLAFRVRKVSGVDGIKPFSLELKGYWRVDAVNRLNFSVARSGGRYDTLKLRGSWDIGKRNELIFVYSSTGLVRSRKIEKQLVFRGYWTLGKDRIVYCLEKGTGTLTLKAALQSESLRAANGTIKYQLGVEGHMRGRSYRMNSTLIFFGKWKLNRDLSVAFYVDNPLGANTCVDFVVEKAVGNNSTLTLTLKGAEDKKMGTEVMFSKPFSDDAELFFFMSKAGEDLRLMGGMTVRF